MSYYFIISVNCSVILNKELLILKCAKKHFLFGMYLNNIIICEIITKFKYINHRYFFCKYSFTVFILKDDETKALTACCMNH